MDLDLQVKLAVYRHFAETGRAPAVAETARAAGITAKEARDAYARLFARRLLVIEPDGESIRMAPPFSGVPTPHRARVGEREYFANCAWDALGVPAALHRPGTVLSSCGHSGEPLRLEVSASGPGPSGWLFHCAVPAARWWQDVVYT
jgi:hypothetical protein